jgi:hypothetical protein
VSYFKGGEMIQLNMPLLNLNDALRSARQAQKNQKTVFTAPQTHVNAPKPQPEELIQPVLLSVLDKAILNKKDEIIKISLKNQASFPLKSKKPEKKEVLLILNDKRIHNSVFGMFGLLAPRRAMHWTSGIVKQKAAYNYKEP